MGHRNILAHKPFDQELLGLLRNKGYLAWLIKLHFIFWRYS
jgi:hypothetical protein